MSKRMLTSPLPSWRQIFFPKRCQEHGYWKNALWTTKSGVSIKLIIQAYSNVYKKRIVKIWIPDFFCAETEEEFKERGVNVVIYANQLTRTGFPAMQNAAKTILEHHRAQECDTLCMPIRDIITLIPEEV